MYVKLSLIILVLKELRVTIIGKKLLLELEGIFLSIFRILIRFL
jgi:hypothetical protein